MCEGCSLQFSIPLKRNWKLNSIPHLLGILPGIKIHKCYLLLYIKFLPHLVASNNKHILSNSFCELGLWMWLSWVPLSQGLKEVGNQDVTGAVVSSESSVMDSPSWSFWQDLVPYASLDRESLFLLAEKDKTGRERDRMHAW